MRERDSPAAPVLRARYLSRTFGRGAAQTRAVADVSLDLFPGAVALLMGPSGSGKSTLLALLSGLLPPDGGRVLALGEDLWRLSDRERRRFRLRHCGFIFQGYNLFPALSARQQLEIVLCWGMGAGRRAARKKAEETLALFGLAQKARLRPDELSGGEKQRLAVARALIKEPTFCFADEPTGALDWAHGRQVVESLREAARRRGAAIVIVSHDPRLVPYADRVHHLEDGRLREEAEAGTDSPGPGAPPPPSPAPAAPAAGKGNHRVPLRGLAVLAVAAILLPALSWLLTGPGRGLAPWPAPEVRTPQPGDRPALVCIGYVDAEGGVLALAPAVPGRVAEVPAEEGRPIRAGAVLLRLEDRVARLQVREAEAALRAAEAQLAEARQAPGQHRSLLAQQRAALAAVQHDLAAARLIAARKERLNKKEEAAVAAEEVKKGEAAEQAGREKLRALEERDPAPEVARAEADVLAKTAQLDKARHGLEECAVRAPAEGTVLRVLAHPGELFSPEARQPALLFCPAGPRLVRAEVEQEFAGRVAVGQAAEVEDDAGAGAPPWTGWVVRLSDWYAPRRTILPGTLPLQDVRTLECLIRLDPGRPPPRIGQRVRVRLPRE
jgi:putative ABC transport system ATP-binding protein